MTPLTDKLLAVPLFENNGAAFSDCGKYRYALWRIWDDAKPLVMIIGLNPSTANQTEDDPTIRRVKRFAKDWGYGGVYMMNCFTYVSTIPEDMMRRMDIDNWEIHEPMGNKVYHDYAIVNIAKKCEEIIFAWGNFKQAVERGKELAALFPNAKALQLNANGSPKHPLYVKADIVPVLFKNTDQ